MAFWLRHNENLFRSSNQPLMNLHINFCSCSDNIFQLRAPTAAPCSAFCRESNVIAKSPLLPPLLWKSNEMMNLWNNRRVTVMNSVVSLRLIALSTKKDSADKHKWAKQSRCLWFNAQNMSSGEAQAQAANISLMRKVNSALIIEAAASFHVPTLNCGFYPRHSAFTDSEREQESERALVRLLVDPSLHLL